MSRTRQRTPSTRAALLVYLLLCGLTLFTWGVARVGYTGLDATLLVLGVALVKGQMIGDWFMSLRGLRGFWRWVIVLWLLLVGGLVTAAFGMASGG
jgi:hypothetical protein